MRPFNTLAFRKNFPLLTKSVNNLPLVYFDNAATMQKPFAVIKSSDDLYQNYNANVHRSSHALSSQVTHKFEQARIKTQQFINAKYSQEIIWTTGTTEGINLVASAWGNDNIKAGDELVLTYSEHHANIVPWQLLAQRTGAIIKVLPLDQFGLIDEAQLSTFITDKTKLVCCAHVSNVIGKINPIEKVIALAKKVNAVTLIDGAQACAHLTIDVQALGCDFYLFSAHKMYGPTGIGLLYGKKALLNEMVPYQSGGEMIKTVSFDKTTFNELPFKFEAGTPNIAGVLGFAKAIDFIKQQNLLSLADYEKQLGDHCYLQLKQIPQVNFVVNEPADIAIVSFTVDGFHNHDVATALDAKGIAIRSGHHCAMPLMKYLKLTGCLRVSLAAYNTFEEVDYFINVIKSMINEHLTETMPYKSAAVINDGSKRLRLTSSKNTLLKDTLAADHSKSMVKHTTVSEIVERFNQVQGWDGRHREIMLLGKTLSRMDKTKRTDNNLIQGCESHAWIIVNKKSDGCFYFDCDSDAKIIRGLMVIVLAA
jgi:SufS family cysteine desulfurase